jgi:hypothetical protein
MRWEDERWVKLFVRDTPDWLSLPWQSRALFPLLLRKADRAGQVALGRSGRAGLSALVSLPVEVVSVGLPGLLEDGCVVQSGQLLTIRNFIEAQDTPMSSRHRQREYRENARAKGLKSLQTTVTRRYAVTRSVTPRVEEPRGEETRREDQKPLVPELPGTERVGPVPHSFDEKGNRPEDQVFEHWRQKLRPKAHVFDDDTRKKVLARLKEGFTVEELKQAIDGCASNPHNQGVNDKQKRYDSLELICRNGGNVVRFQGYAEKPASSFKPGGFQRADGYTEEDRGPKGDVDLDAVARELGWNDLDRTQHQPEGERRPAALNLKPSRGGA